MEHSYETLITLFDNFMKTITTANPATKESFLASAKKLNDPDTDGCWLKAIGRGVGKVIHSCKDDQEQSGLLCYPKCKQNYTGAGPVCWENCQSNFRDDGAYCFKTPAYGRGTGYIHQDKCLSENPETGCDKYGLLYYPTCKSGYKNFGCCVCTPKCLDSQTDIGISCNKASYGRGVGTPLGCDNNQDYDAGLCYKKCDSGFKGIGPVCWRDTCPTGYDQCGALCLKGETCADEMKQYFQGVIDIIAAFAAKNYPEGVIDIAKFVTEFIYPICDN